MQVRHDRWVIAHRRHRRFEWIEPPSEEARPILGQVIDAIFASKIQLLKVRIVELVVLILLRRASDQLVIRK